MNSYLEKVIERARKLLSFTPDNATPEECANAAAALKAMMEKYQLTQADLEGGQVGEEIAMHNLISAARITWEYLIASALCQIFTCKYIVETDYSEPVRLKSRKRKPKYRRMAVAERLVIVGFQSDVESVRVTYLAVATALIGCALRRGIKASLIKSFMAGAGDAIVARFKQEKPEEQCVALVLLKAPQVEEKYQELYPQMKLGRSSRFEGSAYDQGYREGMDLDIGTTGRLNGTL